MDSDYFIDVSTGYSSVVEPVDKGVRAFEDLVLNNGFNQLCDNVKLDFINNPRYRHSTLPAFDVWIHKTPYMTNEGKKLPGYWTVNFIFTISSLLRMTDTPEQPWKNRYLYKVSKDNFRDVVMKEMSGLDRPISGKGMVEIWFEMILKKVADVYEF